MIGYYVHHHGRGHLSRAIAIAEHLRESVTGLSSLPRPQAWAGDWVQLPLDVDPAASEAEIAASDVVAGGRLHWAPLRQDGLRDRMASISRWIAATHPSVFVSDVSVEVAVFARLHGVPVVTVALPGRRVDAAHRLGFAVSTAIISAWPAAMIGMLEGLDDDAERKHVCVGAISRYPPRDAADPAGRAAAVAGVVELPARRVLVLNGGGGGMTASELQGARRATPGWEWDAIGGSHGRWMDDPWPLVLAADVVVTHAGQNAVADVAAARKPAVLVPQPRPHDEQLHTAAALNRGVWPVVTASGFDSTEWAQLLEKASRLDGDRWSGWNDGSGAARAAAIIETTAASGPIRKDRTR